MNEQIQNIPTSSKQLIKYSGVVSIGIITIFTIWMFTAQLDSATVAMGTVVPSGEKTVVTYDEVGIIRQILKYDGAVVKAGEAIVQLDDTEYKANLSILEEQRDLLKQQIARLEAQSRGKTKLQGVGASDIYQNELAVFKAKKEMLEKEKSLYYEKVKQLDSEMESNSVILRNTIEQLNAAKSLYDDRYVEKTRVLDLESRVADLHGKLESLKARKNEAQTQFLKLKNQSLIEPTTDISKKTEDLKSVEDRILAISMRLKRKTVVSPVNGIVNRITQKTIGSTIAPGTIVAEIVSSDAKAIVEAKVSSEDIAFVMPGLPCYLRFPAYKTRYFNAVNGKVIWVAVDSKLEQDGKSYYMTRIEMEDGSLRKEGITPTIGMQSQVEILLGTRSVARYMFDPIRMSLLKSFRER